uniref:Uncharacterized protein n=1 Tax=Nelumbo nucifera TaxID=4432 RepID=A0A822ZEG5_NELNU|nr:TPA_asm: hypothetical protein HUJ06_001130 [Nelumbo nucifera]
MTLRRWSHQCKSRSHSETKAVEALCAVVDGSSISDPSENQPMEMSTLYDV